MPTQTSNFDQNPGDPGRHVQYRTHARSFLLKEMLEVGSELVSSTMPNVMVLPYCATGVKDRSITRPRVYNKPCNGRSYRRIFYISQFQEFFVAQFFVFLYFPPLYFFQILECEAFQIFCPLVNFQTLEMFPGFTDFPGFLGRKKRGTFGKKVVR